MMEASNALYGITPVMQSLLHRKREIYQLFVNDKAGSPRLKEIIVLAGKIGIKVHKVDAHKLGKLVNTKKHQNVVLTCGELQTHDLGSFIDEIYGEERKLLVALDQIEDPQNVGAIIRTAAFLGAQGLIILERNTAPLGATTSKSSAGAMEYFPLIQVKNLSECLQRLRKEGFQIVGASSDEDSMNYQEHPLLDATVLVMGSEGQGLRKLTKKRCDALVRIPGNEETESLNVSAASAILIQHFLS